MKKLLLLLVAMSVIGLTGCGERVPPGYKGKNGYNKEVLVEGRYAIWGYDQLVLLDMTTNIASPTFSVRMNDHDSAGNARPGLDMDFTVSYRYRLRNDDEVINTMFNDLRINPKDGVTAGAVYATYAAPIIEATFRDVIGQYEPEDVLANRALAGKKFAEELAARMKNNPIILSDVMIKSMNLPKVISDRIKENKDKELQITKEEASQAIEMVKKDNLQALEVKQNAIDLLNAQALAAQNKALASGLSDEILELRRLEIAKIQAEAVKFAMENGKTGDTIVIPYEAMSNIGAQTRMFAK